MKILMDSDCLIKLTKTGLKEPICKQYDIVIPFIVKKEVVDAGKSKGLSDAESVDKNIQDGIIHVVGKESLAHIKGDKALIEIFRQGEYDSIATDDAKLIKILKSTGIPFVLPGLLIYSLYHKDIIDRMTALNWLEKLSAFISEDEHSMIKFLLEGKS